MEIKSIENWREFDGAVDEILEEYNLLSSKGELLAVDGVLYRGQEDSEWELSTTLERFSDRKWNVGEYCRAGLVCESQIESFTGTKWNLPDLQIVQEELKRKGPVYRANIPSAMYPYWAYLRHHGFPSPLLDWTRSPYLAAFFAFYKKTASEFVSIYVYIEIPRAAKIRSGGNPSIDVMDPYTKTHKRHFLQKSQYTACTQYDLKKQEHYFVPHQGVFEVESEAQDVLIKIKIPSSERITALKDLDRYNINLFSLFGTEDALVQSLAFSAIELKDF